MYTVKEIVSAIEELAPKELAESWTIPGLWSATSTLR